MVRFFLRIVHTKKPTIFDYPDDCTLYKKVYYVWGYGKYTKGILRPGGIVAPDLGQYPCYIRKWKPYKLKKNCVIV